MSSSIDRIFADDDPHEGRGAFAWLVFAWAMIVIGGVGGFVWLVIL